MVWLLLPLLHLQLFSMHFLYETVSFCYSLKFEVTLFHHLFVLFLSDTLAVFRGINSGKSNCCKTRLNISDNFTLGQIVLPWGSLKIENLYCTRALRTLGAVIFLSGIASGNQVEAHNSQKIPY